MTLSDDHAMSTIFLFAGRDLDEAADQATEHISSTLRTSPVLLPSSLDRRDDLLQSLRRSLRKRSTSSSVAIPDPPRQLVTGVISRKRTTWRRTTLVLPDKPDREVLLPLRLFEGDPLLYVTHVNSVARTGPFQLDLLSRYLHLRARMRQLTDPDRAGLAAEINVALRPDWCVVGCDVPPAIVAVTRDLVAGELVALSVAERFFDRHATFSSPWEDRVVQRATELELGARTPDEIRIEIMTSEDSTPEGVQNLVDSIRLRIGIVSRDTLE